MTNETSKRPRQFPLRVIFILVAIIGVYAVIIRPLSEFGRTLKSEYDTQTVIRMVEQYVRAHDGKWPSSWSDLGQDDGSDFPKYTRINFTIRSENLLKDRDMIYSAITPTSGEYTIYPNADRNLESLLQAIIESTTVAAHTANGTPATLPTSEGSP
ncbi:MAG: hypothetical protein ACYC3X_29130 [Pirellulaceae bacterium]